MEIYPRGWTTWIFKLKNPAYPIAESMVVTLISKNIIILERKTSKDRGHTDNKRGIIQEYSIGVKFAENHLFNGTVDSLYNVPFGF